MSTYHTIIHTDGGAAPNPGEGAYVAILQNGEKAAAVRGYAPHATNQQMELAAAIAGLSALKSTRIPVHVYTDSQYLQGGASMWIRGWRKNSWKTAAGAPLANVELWQELDRIMAKYVITWIKVDGHAGVEMNVKADHLVQDTRDARGIASRFQVVDIPTIESPWNFEQFMHQAAAQPRPEVQYLRDRFSGLMKGPQG
ncbi:MAG: ribonuclease HI [Anaerolineales bacterium]|nr:ribonuclease HI [Anaerolineales bacterium]